MEALLHLVRIVEANKGFLKLMSTSTYPISLQIAGEHFSQEDLPPESFQNLTCVPGNAI
jgi:hypothetical protein